MCAIHNGSLPILLTHLWAFAFAVPAAWNSSLSLWLCAKNATSSVRPLLISQTKQISPGVAFPWQAAFPSLTARSSLCLHVFLWLKVNFWSYRHSVSFICVKTPGASVVPAAVLELTTFDKWWKCVLWVKPRSVLPESQDTQHACKKALAKSQVPLEVNTSCNPL